MAKLVYATQSYEYMLEAFCRQTGFQRGKLDRKIFPDGERYVRIFGDIRGRDALLIGGTPDDVATLDLYDTASGLVSSGVNNLTIVIPYFGYSTQERAVQHGEVVKAKTRAVLLSSVPRASASNSVVLVDLHTPGIAYYFENDLHCVELRASQLVLELVRRLQQDGEETIIGCTDAGRAKWVQSLANEASVPASFVYKSRISGSQTTITGVNADVKDKHVLIYDDMVRTGGSLMQAANAYRNAGASKVTAMVTHGVLPNDSIDRLKASNLFECLHCTDTHPAAVRLAADHHDFLYLHSVIPVLVDHFV